MTSDADHRLLNACWDGDVELARGALLDGAHPNAVDLAGNSALKRAALQGYPEIVAMLIEAGADVRRVDVKGRTVLSAEHIKRTQAEARKTFTEEIAGQQALRLAQLDSVLQEALDAWQASRAEESSTVTEGRVAVLPQGGEGQDPVVPLPDLVVRHTRKTGGDPALLGRVLEAIEDIRQLLGLDAPKRVQVEPTQEPIKLYAGIDLDKV